MLHGLYYSVTINETEEKFKIDFGSFSAIKSLSHHHFLVIFLQN